MSASVRTLRASDLPVVGRLLRDSFDSGLRRYMTYTQAGVEEFLALRLEYPASFSDTHGLVMTDDDEQPIAFADFRLIGDTAFLSYVCVSPRWRGHGAAPTLISHFLGTTGLPASRMELDVFDESLAARRLYDRLGFTCDRRSLWLSRTLPPAGVPIKVPDIKDVAASLRRYGFCDMTVENDGRPRRLGVLGETVLRCFDTSDLDDDDLLAGVRATFPLLAEAFAIAADDSTATSGTKHRIVNRSSRMSSALPLAASQASES